MGEMTADRTVHASNHSCEVVRYDRAGKWYIEDKHSGYRRNITLAEAVDAGIDLWYNYDGTIHFDRPGGRSFNSRVRQRASGG